MSTGMPDFVYQARLQLIGILKQNGPLPAEQAIADVLAAENVPLALAPVLMELVTRGDERFQQVDGGSWAFVENDRSAFDAVDWVVIDVETTGGKPPADRITELGAVRVNAGRIVDEFETLVDPEREIPLNVQRITHITDAMVAGKPTAAQVMPAFREWLGDAVVVAHNAPFDRFFIDTHFAEIFGGPTENLWLCSVRLTRKLYPHFPSKSLGPLCVSLGIPPRETLHRAGNDARATARVLVRALDDLAGRGITNLDALWAFVSPTVLGEKRRKQLRGADPFDDVVELE